jgi:hypothetical protein
MDRGGWDINAPHAKRSSGHFETKKEAEDRGREILRNLGGGELTIHDKHNKIIDSDTVPKGNDPNPPRDKK